MNVCFSQKQPVKSSPLTSPLPTSPLTGWFDGLLTGWFDGLV